MKNCPLVSVLILNYKQFSYLPACLDALQKQSYHNIEVIYSDNASLDDSVVYVESTHPNIKVIAHQQNLYYAKAHNIAIRQAQGSYILPLNVDIILESSYIEKMVETIEIQQTIGMVSGKLLRMDTDLRRIQPPIIDSTGMWFSPEMRHFDRGSGEEDFGQYDRLEYIFGPSGAAPLYRRSMLEDIAWNGDYFDEDFVIYREDAELAWRAQLLGWKSLYTPDAVGYHVRGLRPEQTRGQVAPVLNMHSVKNRFLMRIKNQTMGHAAHFICPMVKRDLQVIGYVLAKEHTSLPAFAKLIALLPRTLKKRQQIMSRRKVDDHYIEQWFSNSPVSLPVVVDDEKLV